MNKSCEKMFTLLGISRSINIQLLSHCKTILECQLPPLLSDPGTDSAMAGVMYRKHIPSQRYNTKCLYFAYMATANFKTKQKIRVGMQMERKNKNRNILSLLSHIQCSDNLHKYWFQENPEDAVTYHDRKQNPPASLLCDQARSAHCWNMHSEFVFLCEICRQYVLAQW